MPNPNQDDLRLPGVGESPHSRWAKDALERDLAMKRIRQEMSPGPALDDVPNQEDLEVTAADKWNTPKKKAQEGFKVELPSGNIAKVRRSLDLLEQMRDGSLPNPLMAIVQTMMVGKPAPDPKEFSSEELMSMFEWIDDQCIKCFLEPKLVKKPEDAGDDWQPPADALLVSELDIRDKMFIARLSQGGSADLRQFREFTDPLMAGVFDGDLLRLAAESVGGS